MTSTNSQVVLEPNLNLPQDILQELQEHIATSRVVPSFFNLSANTGKTFWEKLLFKFYFGTGQFQVYRIDQALEDRITAHYQDFLKLIPAPAKIRLKSTQGVRSLLPHSDAAEGGDTASLTIAVVTNGEITNWHNAGPEFKTTPFSLLRLKKTKSVCLEPGQACLFNNSAVHSVTNCQPGAKRYVLTIGWQTVDFDQVLKAREAWNDHNH